MNSDITTIIEDAIAHIAVGPGRGKDITSHSARKIMGAILDGVADPVQAAIFFIGLRMKGEALPELTGLYDGLQDKVTPEVVGIDEIYYLAEPFDGCTRHHPCGPFVPAVLAANGINSISFGLPSVGPKHGVNAFKVLQAAGVDVDQSVAIGKQSLQDFGWTYLDQTQYLPLLSDLRKFRDKMVKRTAITTLERLVKPIVGRKETHLIIGYVHKPYLLVYKELAKHAGFNSCMLTKGVEGGIVPALNKPLRNQFSVFASEVMDQAKECPAEIPQELKSEVAASQLVANDEVVQRTLNLGLAALSGEQGDFRKSLVVSSANILSTHKPGLSFTEAVVNVENCLDNGTALEKFQLHATLN